MKKISFIIAFSAALLSSCSSKSQSTVKGNSLGAAQQQSPADSIKQIPNKQVCMINNKFMNKDQIPVPVSEKIYYGCCQGCVLTLKNDSTSRYDTDPLTNEKVDKAKAFVIIKPGSQDEVLYFKSESNARKYLKNNKK
jgi:PBP1b-binding outer membrane lipoprotein LpoB